MSAVRRWVSGIVLVAGSMALPAQGSAQQEVSDSASIEARLNELDQQVRILQRLRELAAESAATAAKDEKYTLKIRGYLHADGRFFLSDDAKAIPNTFFLRRARPIIEASVGKYFDFRIMPDFGQGATTLFDAYWEGKFVPEFAVRAGKFKPPVGLERIQSATDITFAERGMPTNLAPNRDVGLQVAGEMSGGVFAYQVGIFNGVPDLGNGDGDNNDSKDLAGRIFLQPIKQGSLKGLGFGVSASTGKELGTTAATALPGYRSASQQTFFRYRTDATTPVNTAFADGRRTRVSPQAYLGLGSLGVLGEYIISSQEVRLAGSTAKLTHKAWQASAGYFLTGEQAGFRSPAPKQPFDLKKGTFGALELAARYGELEVDDDAFPTFANPASASSKAKDLGFGVNWYASKQIKVVVNYEHTTYQGGAADGDRPSEDFVVTRFQHAF